MKRSSQFLLLGLLLVSCSGGLLLRERSATVVNSSSTAIFESPKACPTSGLPFEIPIGQMPFPSPTPHPIDAVCPRGGTDDKNLNHRAPQTSLETRSRRSRPTICYAAVARTHSMAN